MSALVNAIVEMARATDLPALKRARMKCERMIGEMSPGMECEMDLERIAALVEAAAEAIREIEAGNASDEETSAIQWRVMAALAEVSALASTARVRVEGQVFIRRLIVEECERLVSRCRRAVMGGE